MDRLLLLVSKMDTWHDTIKSEGYEHALFGVNLFESEEPVLYPTFEESKCSGDNKANGLPNAPILFDPESLCIPENPFNSSEGRTCASNHANLTQSLCGEFVNVDLWAAQYHRNNKRGGLKNIRCFPHCTDGTHKSKGFCGAPIRVVLTQKDLAPFSSKRDYVVCMEIGKTMQSSEERTIKIGENISREKLNGMMRTASKPFNNLIEGKQIMGPKSSPRDPNLQAVSTNYVFQFHYEKRGWHYGFAGNKHLSKTQHCVRALVFTHDATHQGDLKCVNIVTSPSFTLTCRRRKDVCGDEEDAAASSEDEKSAKSGEQNTYGLKRCASDVLTDGAASPDIGSPATKRPKRIGSHFFALIANLLKVPAERFNEPVNNLVRLGKEKTKTARKNNRMKEQKISSSSSSSDAADGTVTQENIENIRVGLGKLAKFILQEDDLTNLCEKILDNGDEPSQSIDEITKVLIARFDNFLAGEGAPPVSELAKFNFSLLDEEAIVKPKMCCPAWGYLEHPDKETMCLPDSVTSQPVQQGQLAASRALGAIVGNWKRSERLLDSLERIYTKVGFPWLLRKCIRMQSARFSVLHDNNDPLRLMVFNQRKLFSSGYITYCFDNSFHPFTVPSPLLLQDRVCKLYRAFLDGAKLKIENYFNRHRIVRSIELSPCGNQLYISIKLEEGTPKAGLKNITGHHQEMESWTVVDEIRNEIMTRV